MLASQKGLSGFQLKIIALVGMLVDHINTYFGAALGLPLWFSWVGRFVAPVFLYLLVEGYSHTRHKKAYFYRLLAGAGLMWGINIAKNVLTQQYYDPFTGQFDPFLLLNGYNIFQTLTVFFVMFVLIDRFKSTSGVAKYLNVLGIVLLLPLILMSEGGIQLLPLALIFACFDNRRPYVTGVLVVTSLLWLLKAVIGYMDYGHTYQTLYQHLTFDNQFMQILALPLLLSYNGQRGGTGRPWESRLFYVFYPVHLVVIYGVNAWLGL